MKSFLIDYLRERFQSIHPRTRRAQLNTLVGLFVKGSGMFISLLLVPLTIDYLSKETYGTWLTLSSIASMLALFDIGLGNGLRNKLSEAITKQNILLARSYVSTAYLIFGLLQLTFIAIFLLVFRYVPWPQILNTPINNGQLQLVVLMTAISIMVKMLLDNVLYILFALQQSGLVSFINFLANSLILIGTYTLTHSTNGNLVYLASITAVSPIFVLTVSSFVLFRNQLKAYRPALYLADLKHAKSLLSLGYKFFIIQIAVVVLFYSDNLIIAQLFGSTKVTVYNTAFRYFNAATTLFAIVITPYWSAFTEASTKNDTDWMKRTYVYLQKVWLFFVFIVAVMVILADYFYWIWVGNRVMVPTSLNLIMGLNVVIVCWNTSTVAVINGLGKIKLQFICSIFAASVNVPLAVYLGRNLGLGTTGVMLSTCLSLLPAMITGTIQAKKLVNGNAHGTWAS